MPVNILMPALASKNGVVASKTTIAIFGVVLVMATHCIAEPVKGGFKDGGHLGPMNIQRYNEFKQRLNIQPSEDAWLSYVGNRTYQDVVNILIESVLQSEGSIYCLPYTFVRQPGGMLFFDMVRFVDAFVKDASPEEFLREAIVDRLAVEYPCPRK